MEVGGGGRSGEEGAIGEEPGVAGPAPGLRLVLGVGSPPTRRRCSMRCPLLSAEQHVLEELERQAVLVYTPSRKVSGKRVVCYDDRYIVKVAYDLDGVIVSNDNYRDLQSETPEWKWFIEQRLLMFSFVNDRYVVPMGSQGAWDGGGDQQKPLQLARARGAQSRALRHLPRPPPSLSASRFSSLSRPVFPLGLFCLYCL